LTNGNGLALGQREDEPRRRELHEDDAEDEQRRELRMKVVG
jgi:hypothetical protein